MKALLQEEADKMPIEEEIDEQVTLLSEYLYCQLLIATKLF